MVTHPNRQDTRRLRFSFFLNDVKQREGFGNPSADVPDAKIITGPLLGGTGNFEPVLMSSHEIGGAGRRLVLSGRRYMRRTAAVSSFSWQYF